MATILVVDDLDLLHGLVRQALEQHNHNLIHVYTGAAALDALEDRDVELMLLDLNLPDMTGFDVLDQLRECAKQVIVVMFSSEFSQQHEATALGKGARAYWEKCAENYLALGERIADVLSSGN